MHEAETTDCTDDTDYTDEDRGILEEIVGNSDEDGGDWQTYAFPRGRGFAVRCEDETSMDCSGIFLGGDAAVRGRVGAELSLTLADGP